MTVARKYLKLLAVFSAMLALVVSCSKSSSPLEPPVQGGDQVEPSGFPVSLAFGMKDVKYSPATKTLAQVAQADGSANSFRGMSGIWFLPFDVQREIRADDTRSGDYLRLPYEGISDDFGDDGSSGSFQGLVNSNNSHYYKSIYIPSGTASFLVYGKAKEVSPVTVGTTTYTSGTQAYKHLYGSLIASDEASGGTAGVKASDITFSPDPIADATARAAIVSKAQKLADMLNSILNIANTNYTSANYSLNVYRRRGNSWNPNSGTFNYTFSWTSDYGNAALQSLRTQLINTGMFAASGPAITALLQRLYRGLANTGTGNVSYEDGGYTYSIYKSRNTSDPYSYSALYLATIGERIKNFATVSGSGASATLTLSDNTLKNFPGDLGLPEGCVAIKWDGSKFAVISEGSYDIHLAPMDRFCYPPSLWYYVNSQISCAKKLNSEDDDAVAERAIAAYYKNTSATWTSILDQYNTGQRKFGPVVRKGAVSVAVNKPMQYGVALLKLNLNTTASTLKDADNADVTVSNTLFPMTAVIVAGQHKQSFDFTPQTGNEYYVYDNMPLSDAGGTLAWITSLANTNNPSYTLLLQSLQAEDVIICIEFQNNSSTTFKGETGYIVPGSKFYLLGTLTYGSGQGNQTLVKSVFQQDYVTEVNLTINSLKKAFNCIPDLQDPQLEVGVEIDIDWILATPSEIPLY
ncbi:MAG: hypothetical protein J6W86_03390 [Bacteroidales bacterium]|nr:hypothetical protein [Bacteroidales bacterium]